jgi:hypothetical protein
MSKLLIVVAFAGVVGISQALAKESCPTLSSGPLPWSTDEIMSGDRYADIYLDIDAQGKPTGCRMGKNNIPGDDKFFICNAFMQQWSTHPPEDAGKGGATTVKRNYFEYGMRHADAERSARKKFFREHPYERAECYPNED